VKLFHKLQVTKPEFTPQVIMVDGNGVLHQNACGLASHLGVLIDKPTIGVGKTVFYVDGLRKVLHKKDLEGSRYLSFVLYYFLGCGAQEI